MNPFKYSAAAAVGVALALTISSAHADSISDYVHLELGAGVSWYKTLSDGVWYQQGMQHSLGLSAPVLMGGFTGPLWKRESWGVDWHADYVSLGHVSSQCECTPDDANYNTQTHSLVANPHVVPNANFVGNGNAQGITLTLEPYGIYRGWRIGVEGGLFIFRPAWDETIYHWQGDTTVAPQTLTAHTSRSPQIGEVVGFSVGRGPLSVAYQHYFMPAHDKVPTIWSGADVLMVRYRY